MEFNPFKVAITFTKKTKPVKAEYKMHTCTYIVV